ncbi:outer membrane protein OmpK [Coraliomargarita sp. SDUM461004]|uniref:Outer membrane protein OmpK n=1 Tax=Thalassobacterium sedimentorum TaxID=3041258 RepID=A0ABU1APP8_9BACT|nr:outer membrane protein OmpK [Coraliomargarita sp. SDUM461004]MDQ8195835.1 outer membrane protein OmpK [Coraliomargarita sp. SDUM461004]
MKTLQRLIQIATLINLLSISHTLQAEALPTQGDSNQWTSKWILWQDFSLSYLNGDNYRVDPDRQQTVSFEHVSEWRIGDSFLFIDYLDYLDTDEEESAFYGEFSPRLSLGKVTDYDWSLGPIDDLLLASTYEFGEGDVESLLYGIGIDLSFPGFDYFHLNLYYRDPQNNGSRGWQLTPCFGYTFPVGKSEILIDGYIDYVFASENSNYHTNLHINPQIKYNLGKLLWDESHRLYVGVEYDYWTNKYGIKDSNAFRTDQNTYSLLLKYHF